MQGPLSSPIVWNAKLAAPAKRPDTSQLVARATRSMTRFAVIARTTRPRVGQTRRHAPPAVQDTSGLIARLISHARVARPPRVEPINGSTVLALYVFARTVPGQKQATPAARDTHPIKHATGRA